MKWQWLCVWMLLLAACESAPAPTPTAPRAPTPQSSPPAAPTAAATRSPATPRATSAPTALSTATRPSALTPPPTPRQPPDWPQAILAYLNSDPQAFSNLRAVLHAWGVNGPTTPLESVGDILLSADADADGQQDLLVALAPAEPNSCEFGSIVLYFRRGDQFRIGQQLGLLAFTPIDPKISHIPCPKLIAARDLLKDGGTEIVYSSANCGAHTCFVEVDILRWNGRDLRSLMTQPLPSMAYPAVSFQDTGRASVDLVLHGGIIASAGAGPQRARREIYRWDGTRFALVETTYDASNFLYFKIVDANARLQQRQIAEAIALYQDAINNPKLELSELHPNERADLQAFAQFRLSVAHALLGDSSASLAAVQRLLRNQPLHLYTRVAQTFWDAYAPQKNVAAGCLAVTNLARTNPAIPLVLSDFGYANPDFTADEVCPFR